ncbi:hypothetical protein BaRGS_00012001, partial [Batillaria attramentaria]
RRNKTFASLSVPTRNHRQILEGVKTDTDDALTTELDPASAHVDLRGFEKHENPRVLHSTSPTLTLPSGDELLVSRLCNQYRSYYK